MNEFFLVSITLLTAIMKGHDKPAAILYGLVAHMVYFFDMFSVSPAASLLFAGISDGLVVLLLICLSGCLRSRLTFFLIPLSFVSLCVQIWGWFLVMTERSDYFWLHDSLSVFYMCVIIALFALAAGGYGNFNWDNRLLRRGDDNPTGVGMVPK